MDYNIGRQLGILLAHFQDDLRENPDNVEALQKIRLISESYKNFATGEKPGFVADFEAGHSKGVAVVKQVRAMDDSFGAAVEGLEDQTPDPT